MSENKGIEDLYNINNMFDHRKEDAYESIICVLKFVEENIKIFLDFY